jgi:eukaryotic-like serine/threonine-protein kinase
MSGVTALRPNEAQEIGGYRLLGRLGEGGMGTVYLAQQQEPVRRRVALKVIKLGMDSRQVLARFAVERQALALLNHDNIARVFDAGTTDRGQPYFVMEHVEGLPITDYCERHQLDLKARIALFGRACAGVQRAHQKGVIHRDLKPGNILVTRGPGSAEDHRLRSGARQRVRPVRHDRQRVGVVSRPERQLREPVQYRR